jgi:hypothetical protein
VIERLRIEALEIGVRLGRIGRSTPAQGGDWLIELDRRAGDPPLEEDVALATVLTELGILGLRPNLFVISPPLAPLPCLEQRDARSGVEAWVLGRGPAVR